jgi:serine/threonine-protein kinase
MTQPYDAAAVFTQRYEDRGSFGQGASADVRRVFDRVLEREVALKVVRLDRAHELRAVRRLRSEAVLSGRLFHPSIPPVFDRDVLADGRPFFTMRAIPGATLMDETIRFHRNVGPGGVGGAQQLRGLVERVREVADAVATAHAQGILHRDLKLANVVLPHHGPAQVVDWGLAVDLARPPKRLSRAGTRGYMPPEQEFALPSSLAPTADVYAMGEMLARILFGAGHKNGQANHPLHAPPEALARVCERARSPAPERRYADAAALRDALDEALAATAITETARPRLAC